MANPLLQIFKNVTKATRANTLKNRRSLKLPWQQVTPANQRYRAYMVKK